MTQARQRAGADVGSSFWREWTARALELDDDFDAPGSIGELTNEQLVIVAGALRAAVEGGIVAT